MVPRGGLWFKNHLDMLYSVVPVSLTHLEEVCGQVRCSKARCLGYRHILETLIDPGVAFPSLRSLLRTYAPVPQEDG